MLRPLLRILQLALRLPGGLLVILSEWIGWFRLRYLDYKPRPDDVFVVTYPRSGTTWLQMILYQLTTDGDMNFGHISQFVPWFERFSNNGKDIESLPSPRLFKSHLPWRGWRSVPKGPCKYIYVIRDGLDVLDSYHSFARSHLRVREELPVFFRRFMRGKLPYGAWFRHVAGWLEQWGDPRILFLRFEDLQDDLPGCIRRIAAFCGFEIADVGFPRIVARCGFEFMKRHEPKFDHFTGMLWDDGYEVGAFIRQGRSGSGGPRLTDAQRAEFETACAKWLGAWLAQAPHVHGPRHAGVGST